MESVPEGFDPPGGAGIIAFVVDEEFFVYGDPCDWRNTRPSTPATTVEEIVAALASQASRNSSVPEDITIDGYAGMKITLRVPDDAIFADCDEGTFASFGVTGEDPALYAQGPGEVDEILILEVDGRIALIEGGYYPETPQKTIDELHAILRSAILTPPELPEITDVEQLGAQAIPAPASADWILVDSGRAWVSEAGEGIAFYDVQTGLLEGSVAVPQSPCAGMDSGFGALWTATCGERGVARVDPQTGEMTGWVAVDVPAEGESSVGAGEGAIWAIADGDACTGCVLVRIDPQEAEITATYDVPEGGTAVRAGLGGVWITYASEDRVARVDPGTGEIVSSIEVGSGPRFLAVGEGGVWVMNQSAGSVSHIDPASNTVVATIAVDGEAIFGGDVAVGAGFVWLRGSRELVAQIDPATDRVIARIGFPQASGGVDAGDGQLWIAGHFEEHDGWHAVLYRIPFVDS